MIRILAIMAMLISLASCKKCAECTTTVTTTVGSKPAVVGESKQELCGDDLKEADGNTITSTSTQGLTTVTMVTKTECD